MSYQFGTGIISAVLKAARPRHAAAPHVRRLRHGAAEADDRRVPARRRRPVRRLPAVALREEDHRGPAPLEGLHDLRRRPPDGRPRVPRAGAGARRDLRRRGRVPDARARRGAARRQAGRRDPEPLGQAAGRHDREEPDAPLHPGPRQPPLLRPRDGRLPGDHRLRHRDGELPVRPRLPLHLHLLLRTTSSARRRRASTSATRASSTRSRRSAGSSSATRSGTSTSTTTPSSRTSASASASARPTGRSSPSRSSSTPAPSRSRRRTATRSRRPAARGW